MCGRHDPRLVQKRGPANVQILRFFQHGRLQMYHKTKEEENNHHFVLTGGVLKTKQKNKIDGRIITPWTRTRERQHLSLSLSCGRPIFHAEKTGSRDKSSAVLELNE